MWRPDRESLQALRDSIVDDPKGWRRVRDAKTFRTIWDLGGESLKRAPRGYPDDHPMIEDLKRTDHIAVCTLTKQDLGRADLVKFVAERYRRTKSYMQWLASALALPF